MYTVYAYWNSDQVQTVLNAIALIMSGDDYLGLVKAIAIAGLLVAVGGAIVKMRGEEPIGYFVMLALFYGTLFVPKVTVTVEDLRTSNVYTVANVPLGAAFFASQTSHIGKWLTESFETNFTSIDDAKFEKTGLAFGSRLVEELQMIKIRTPSLQQNMIAFVKDCVNPELLDNSNSLNEMIKSNDLWGYIGGSGSFTLNPGRTTIYNNSPVPCDGGSGAYTLLTTAINAEVAAQATALGNRLNAGHPAADTIILSQIPAIEGLMLNVTRTAQESIKQGMAMHLMRDSQTTIAQLQGNPHAAQVALAVSMAEQSSAVSYAAMAKVAQGALPLLRNAIELIVIAIFPIFFIIVVMSGIRAGLVVRSYLMVIFWVQLWAPLYAVINYLSTTKNALDLQGAMSGAGGNTLENMGTLANTALSNQHIAGLLTISVPIIALALVRGGQVAMSGVVSSIMGPAQGAAQKAGDSVGQGNVSAGNFSWGNVNTNNSSMGNWSSNNASFSTASGNKDDRSSSKVDPKMNAYTDQWGSDYSTSGSGKVTSNSWGSSMRSVTPSAQHGSERSNETYSGAESGWAQRSAATLNSSVSAMSNALRSASFGKEFNSALMSQLSKENTYGTKGRESIGANVERGTANTDQANTGTSFTGSAQLGLGGSGGTRVPGGRGGPAGQVAAPSIASSPGSSGTIIDADTGKVVPPGANVPALRDGNSSGPGGGAGQALSKLASALSGRVGIQGNRIAETGSNTQLSDALRGVLSSDRAYEAAVSAADKVARTGSTSEVRAMGEQFSALLQSGRTATLASETSSGTSANAGKRDADRQTVGSGVSQNLGDAGFEALSAAGFSRPEARRAMEDSTHPRHQEALGIVNAVARQATGDNANPGFSSSELNAPRTQSDIATEGGNKVAGADKNNRGAVAATNKQNQAAVTKEQGQQMEAGQASVPANLTPQAVSDAYSGTKEEATTGQQALANGRNTSAGVSAFTSWAKANDMASKGVLGAVLAQPESNRAVSSALEDAMRGSPELRGMVASVGQMKQSGVQPEEKLMQEIAAKVRAAEDKR